jgi:hypothetical protein
MALQLLEGAAAASSGPSGRCRLDARAAGDVVELGCGVGLGGLLLTLYGTMRAPASRREGAALDGPRSMTLTDANREVLRACRSNVRRAQAALHRSLRVPSIRVAPLDWTRLAGEESGCRRSTNRGTQSVYGKFDTVIASDCAYRAEDAPELAAALSNLLSDSNPRAQIHLVGPCHRSALPCPIWSERCDIRTT